MDENSINAYLTEITNLNKSRSKVLKAVKDFPYLNCEALMITMSETERNKVAPRLSDLLRLNLIKVMGNTKNSKGHTESTFKVVELIDYVIPKKINMKTLLATVKKLSQDELRTLRIEVEGLINFEVEE